MLLPLSVRSRIECAAFAKSRADNAVWKYERDSGICHLGNFTQLVLAGHHTTDGLTLMRPNHIIPKG